MDHLLHTIPLNPLDWKYKNEGACNIILSFCGSLSSSLFGQVLRIKKKRAVHVQHSLGELLEYQFVQSTIKPLVGNKYVHSGVPIRVDQNFLQQINTLIFSHRPPNRIGDDVDDDMLYAFLIPDLSIIHYGDSQIPSICVELKPKWGFMTTSPFVHPENQIKYTKCRFCMHQHLKFAQGSVKHISDYCPLDLYSSVPDRVKLAIHSMLQHPQNNLKVYLAGELSYTGALGGRQKSAVDFDLNHLSQKIQNIFSLSKHTLPLDHTLSTLVDIIQQILEKEPVLKNLQKAQKLDDLDVEGIKYLYDRAEKIGLDKLVVGEKDLRFSYEGVHSLIDMNDEVKKNEKVQEKDPSRFQPLDNLTPSEIYKKILDFLTSATLKDCSVMITILPVENPSSSSSDPKNQSGDENFIQISDQVFRYCIAVVDLDPRSISLIPHYHKIDQEIVTTFQTSMKGKEVKKCVL